MLNYVYEESQIRLVEEYDRQYKRLEKEWLNKCAKYKKMLTLIIYPLLLGSFGMSIILALLDFNILNLLTLSIQITMFCFMHILNNKIDTWGNAEFYDEKIKNEIVSRGV